MRKTTYVCGCIFLLIHVKSTNFKCNYLLMVIPPPLLKMIYMYREHHYFQIVKVSNKS